MGGQEQSRAMFSQIRQHRRQQLGLSAFHVDFDEIMAQDRQGLASTLVGVLREVLQG